MADMEYWTDYGLSHYPHFSARRPVDFPPPLRAVVDERLARFEEPFTGITSDGQRRDRLFSLRETGADTRELTEAAQAFLAHLGPEQRDKAVFPLDAEERRRWINVHIYIFRHGVMLEDLDPEGRRLGLELLRHTLSHRGFAQARDIMVMNRLLADIANSPDEFGEWPYFVSIFGDPASGEPWGWQIDGHHLCLNCTVVGDQVVLTPAFMGAEPSRVFDGPFAGTMLFSAEERAGLDLIRSLDIGQAAKAITRPSIRPDDLPRELQHPFDGRMQGGAYHDNVTVPYEGVAGSDLSDAQRRRLLGLVAAYVGWTPEPHAEVKMAEVVEHLDETWFSWMGATENDEPFYYRVQSPVVLIEFDHHPGVVFDNVVPSRNHVHTLMRTPNGNDYGIDLLRQHYDRYDHSRGGHTVR
jgi:hypothetical protein